MQNTNRKFWLKNIRDLCIVTPLTMVMLMSVYVKNFILEFQSRLSFYLSRGRFSKLIPIDRSQNFEFLVPCESKGPALYNWVGYIILMGGVS